MQCHARKRDICIGPVLGACAGHCGAWAATLCMAVWFRWMVLLHMFDVASSCAPSCVVEILSAMYFPCCATQHVKFHNNIRRSTT